MFMVLSSWQSHCESSPVSFNDCRMAPSDRRPKTKPDDIGCESTCTGCQSLHPPSLFIIITQPEGWYLFYHPTEGRGLSRPSWLVTYRYRDGLPAHRWSPILVLTGSNVVQLHRLRPMRYYSTKPNRQPWCQYIMSKQLNTWPNYWHTRVGCRWFADTAVYRFHLVAQQCSSLLRRPQAPCSSAPTLPYGRPCMPESTWTHRWLPSSRACQMYVSLAYWSRSAAVTSSHIYQLNTIPHITFFLSYSG